MYSSTAKKAASKLWKAAPRSKIFNSSMWPTALPADVVQGKTKVTIRFEATNGNDIAGVFGIRMVRGDLVR